MFPSSPFGSTMLPFPYFPLDEHQGGGGMRGMMSLGREIRKKVRCGAVSE